MAPTQPALSSYVDGLLAEPRQLLSRGRLFGGSPPLRHRFRLGRLHPPLHLCTKDNTSNYRRRRRRAESSRVEKDNQKRGANQRRKKRRKRKGVTECQSSYRAPHKVMRTAKNIYTWHRRAKASCTHRNTGGGEVKRLSRAFGEDPHDTTTAFLTRTHTAATHVKNRLLIVPKLVSKSVGKAQQHRGQTLKLNLLIVMPSFIKTALREKAANQTLPIRPLHEQTVRVYLVLHLTCDATR